MTPLIILLAIIYFLIAYMFLINKIGPDIKVMKPRDAWLALFGPILFIKYIVKYIIILLFSFVAFILFMFGCRYIQTDNFNNIVSKIMDF